MTGNPNTTHGSDHDDGGLGREVVDPTTAISGTYTVPRLADRLDRRREAPTAYWVLAIAALILLAEQSVLSTVMYTPVLSSVAREFQTTDVVWILTTFILAAAILAPLMTKLGDVYGKRRMLLIGSGVASLGSLMCVVAPTFLWVLIGRGLMGASAAFLPLAVALMREIVPPRMQAMAIGVATNGVGLMVIGGPLLAGWLTETWGVRAVFVANLLLCAVTPLIMMALVVETPLRIRSGIDYASAALLSVGLFGLLIGLSQLSATGLAPLTVIALVVGAMSSVLWWRRQSRIPEPLISIKLLSKRTIMLPMVSFLSLTAIGYTANYTVSLHWSADRSVTGYGYGLEPFDIAMWLVPVGVVGVLAGILVGLTVQSIGYRNHMIISALSWTVAMIVFAFDLNAPPALVITMIGLCGLGHMSYAAAMCLLLLAAPSDQRGVTLGMKGALSGIAAAVASQIAFLVLSNSITSVVDGAPVYAASGFTTAYLLVAGFGVVAIISAWFIPQGRRVPRSERSATPATTATDPSTVVAAKD